MRNHSIQEFCKYDLVGQAKNLTSYIDIRPHQLLPNQITRLPTGTK